MKVRYVGPSVGVDVLGPNDETLRVERGGSLDVPDEYGAALVLQADWSGGDKAETSARSLAVAIPGLTPGAADALVAAGYSDTSDLAAASDEELDEIDGIGPATITTIRAVVPAEGVE